MVEKKNPTLRITLLPKDTNRHGTIFGGVILSYIDLAAAIRARESCGPYNFVTVAMDKVVFHQPVFMGDVVSFYAKTLKIGTTSVNIKVIVDAQRVSDNKTVRVTAAQVVFVAVDDRRQPLAIKKKKKA